MKPPSAGKRTLPLPPRPPGDDVLRRKCQQRINDYRKHYDRISKDAGLEVRTDKMIVSGFRAVKTVEQLSMPKSTRMPYLRPKTFIKDT